MTPKCFLLPDNLYWVFASGLFTTVGVHACVYSATLYRATEQGGGHPMSTRSLRGVHM